MLRPYTFMERNKEPDREVFSGPVVSITNEDWWFPPSQGAKPLKSRGEVTYQRM